MTIAHSLPADEIVCREFVELVTPYLEDVLPPDERALIERHLDACDGCRTYLEQMRQTIRAIGHISHEPITSRTRDEVLAIFRAWRRERR
jgi:predicted anti-sigma-YlaC factor YlaD